MRLTCPECAARYDVDDALIPPSGREVECANCGRRWLQPGAPMVLRDPQVARSDPLPPPPRPSPSVLEILREEAARELAQRAAAQPAGDGSAAPDDGPDGPAAAPRAARDDDALADLEQGRGGASPASWDALPEDIGEDDLADPPAPAATPEPATPPERVIAELVEDHEIPPALPLPDPAVLAASLHWAPPSPAAAAPAPVARAMPLPPPAPLPRRRPAGPGYDAGFSVALALALLLVGAYLAAPRLAGHGRVGAALGEYRAEADRARLWLLDMAAPPVDRAIAALRALRD